MNLTLLNLLLSMSGIVARGSTNIIPILALELFNFVCLGQNMGNYEDVYIGCPLQLKDKHLFSVLSLFYFKMSPLV